MSFNRILGPDLERADTRASSLNYKDHPEFDEKFRLIDSVLLEINAKGLVKIKDLVNEYDKSDDFAKSSISSQVTNAISDMTGKFRALNGYVKDVNSMMKDSETEHEDVEVLSYMRQRESLAIKRIKNSLNEFKQYQKRFNADISQEWETSTVDMSENQHEQQQQAQIQISYEPINAEQLEQQTLEIEEREREIHRIQQDTLEINDIFQNLATIVNEQQFQIDNIEDNLFNYETDARNATDQLRKAERYQRRSGGRMFCCLIILLVVLGFIILVSLI